MPAPGGERARCFAPGRGRLYAPARLGSAGNGGFGRPEQQKRPARFPRGEAQALAFLEIERLRDEADDDAGRARPQGLFDGPEGLIVLLRLDESEALRIETQSLESMAMKPAHGVEARCRGDDEEGAALRKGSHEGGEEAQGRRHIEERSGMDFMDAFQGETLPGQQPVDGRKAEGKEASGISGRGSRSCHQSAQILEANGTRTP